MHRKVWKALRINSNRGTCSRLLKMTTLFRLQLMCVVWSRLRLSSYIHYLKYIEPKGGNIALFPGHPQSHSRSTFYAHQKGNLSIRLVLTISSFLLAASKNGGRIKAWPGAYEFYHMICGSHHAGSLLYFCILQMTKDVKWDDGLGMSNTV